jgi:catechol 2,3-dioxygenase-like lactoylglutathione lyase family enzyme
MHRSRLSAILIDCAESDFDAGVAFWSAALGREAIPEQGDPRYASLRGHLGGEAGPDVTLQRVAAGERAIHLDIESDDVEAEVARLEQLGARVKRRFPEHVVLTAPSGHAFCVVPKARGDFPGDAASWGD